MAVSEGRDVFVVPCNLLDHTADGNKFLMRNGAFVLTGYEDIVEQYHLTLRDFFATEEKLSPAKKKLSASKKEEHSHVKEGDLSSNTCKGVDSHGPSMLSFSLDKSLILSEIPHDRCITVSDILKVTHIPLQQLQPLLLELELEGAIEHQPPRGYINMTRSDILVH